MSGLVGGRYFTHFIALLVLGLLDRGDRLIINCLLRVAFQILAQESSVQRADSAYPLGHGWGGRSPEARGRARQGRALTLSGVPGAPRAPVPMVLPPGAGRLGPGHPHPCALCVLGNPGRGSLSSVARGHHSAFPAASVLTSSPCGTFLPESHPGWGGKSPKWLLAHQSRAPRPRRE